MTATASSPVQSASTVTSPPGRVRRAMQWRPSLPLGIGLLGFVLTFIGSWIPSYWGDEAASVMSAERSLPSLFRMLGHVDAVHGVYYLFLHFWIEAFGASEVSTRFPSAIAAGFIVAGTFVIGQRLARRSVGIAAALVCVLLPRIGNVGEETRSYAISTAMAVWLTILLLELIARGGTKRWQWLLYAIGMTIACYVFLYVALLLVAHAAYLVSSRRLAPFRRRFFQAAVLSGILALPIVWFGYLERSQIAFLAHRDYATPYAILVTQWLGNPYLAVAAWALVVLAVVSAIIAWRRWHERSELIVLAVLWLALPTLALLALNLLSPTYNLRYLTLSSPALALLVVAGAFRIRMRVARAAAIGVVVVLALPTDIGQREQYATDSGSDLAQTASIIGSEAHAGDAVVFDRTTRPSQRPRLGLHLYPSDYAGLEDVALKTPYTHRDGLWDTTWPLEEVAQNLDGIDTVWLVELSGSTDNREGTDVQTLHDLGYREASKQLVNRTIIYKFTEGS